MVELKTRINDDVFIALADATRRDILNRLREGAARITEIAERYPVSLNAVSKHLKILERAGLIRRDIVGREHWCSLNARPLREVQAWVSNYEAFWNLRLDRLDAMLAARKALRVAGKLSRPGSPTPVRPKNTKGEPR
jgi:DNA-binding transcriptional ArsR family regulator